ncbi:MAG: mucoidy inhibitor MuiA family protein [Proteobacteria bacterium]|nr:mucoidy inhibitor MuiA family protein [Pseudomonadota bacterium]
MMTSILLFCGSLALGATYDTDQASIAEVMVYPDRAVVKRTIKVNLPSGQSEFTFTGLPSPLLDGSVRAQVESDGAKVIALTQRQEVRMEERRAEVGELNKTIRELRSEIRKLQIQDGRYQERLALVDQLRDYSRASASLQLGEASVDITTFDRTLTLYQTNSWDALGQRSGLQAKIVDKAQELMKHQQRLEDLRYGRERATTAVTVTVEAGRALSTPLELKYGVNGVSWSPRYDLRYEDEKLELSYLAEVRQSSGEDWQNVDLIFTTARPDEMVPPPDNQPLYLTGYKEKETTVQLGSVREEAKVSETVVADFGGGDSGPGVAVTSRTLSVDLAVPQPSTVPADGRPYRIAVLEKELETKVDQWAAPAQSPRLFLRARTSNQTNMPLLAGPADVFRSSGYVGTIHLSDLANGEKLDLSLGPAGSVLVTRDFDDYRNRTVERSMGRKKIHFVYEILIDNFGEEATQVVISEAIPVSHIEQVKVKIDPETTSGYETDPDGSIWTWTLDLKGGEKKKLKVAYVVELPEDYAWEGF